MAPKKSSALPELDYERAVGPDTRDPRALKTQWPCFGEHPELTVGNNKYAQWKHCAVCCYRVSYVPREGAPGSDSKTENFPTIRKALARLHEDIGDVQPEGEMVKVAIDLEYARNRYHQLIQKFDRKKAPATAPAAPSKSTSLTTARPSMTPALKGGYKEPSPSEEGALMNPNLVDMEDGPPGRPSPISSATSWSVTGSPDQQ